jgi:hypothetical protein
MKNVPIKQAKVRLRSLQLPAKELDGRGAKPEADPDPGLVMLMNPTRKPVIVSISD